MSHPPIKILKQNQKKPSLLLFKGEASPFHFLPELSSKLHQNNFLTNKLKKKLWL